MDQQMIIYVLLAIGVLVILYSVIRDLFTRKKTETPAINNQTTIPLQLQAYERLVLLVERISPENLVSRLYQPGLGKMDMQQLLVQTIKAEYEYNLAQQIYVSAHAWEAVKNVKEQLINLINKLAAQLPETATGNELGKRFVELVLNSRDPFPTQTALEVLNTEAKKLMK